MAHPRIATLLPLAHLHLLADDEYFMALSHAASHPEYMKFYRARAREGKHVVLDNSTIELGHPEDLASYLQKAVAMEATEIILPDWFREADRTLQEMEKALKQIEKVPELSDVLIMAVPQGKNIFEWMYCAETMLVTDRITTLGISARYTDMFGGSRYAAVDLLREMTYTYGIDVRIHLLGCYVPPVEEARDIFKDFSRDILQGMDSSYPAVFASEGLVMAGERPPRNIDFVKDRYDEDLLKENLSYWWEDTCG